MSDEPVIGRLSEVWSSVVDACSGLSDEQWSRKTDCPGWTVRDQVSHLIGVERMLLGDPAPAPITEVPGHVRNSFGELNEGWVDARRSTPGPEVLAEFVRTTDRRVEALRSTPTAVFDEVGWSPVGQVPYRDFMDTRVLDCWAHEQDIRTAVGRPGGRNGAGEATVLERCFNTMPYVVGKKVGPPDGTTVAFAVAGPLGRRAAVTVEAGRASRSMEDPVGPTVTLAMDQHAFWRISFGRLPPLDALASGAVTIEGDGGLGRRVLEAMPFMI